MIRKTYILFLLILVTSSILFAGDKKVLVEILTNSHCPLCPPAHTTIDSYLQSANGDKIEFIYYHMSFPYSSDQLYQHNTSDAAAKNSFYGPHSSTPKAYFDGSLVSNSYNNWSGSLDNLIAEESNFDISLSGNYTDNDFTIMADVTQTGEFSANDLTINYVIAENVEYAGNNGISSHKNVMRKIPYPQGETFSINLNETKKLSSTINYNTAWNSGNLKVIVYVQEKSTKKVLQSASIPYSSLMITDVEVETNLPNEFSLEQNYPNPFNPTTTIRYTVPVGTKDYSSTNVNMRVYNVLGKELKTLVNKQQQSRYIQITFDASSLSNGVYYYQLTAGDFTQTRKMILLK